MSKACCQHDEPHHQRAHATPVAPVPWWKHGLTHALAATVIALVGWILEWRGHMEAAFACWIAVYGLAGWHLLLETTRVLAKGKLDIDGLMVVAVVGSAYLGHWAEGALLLVLFSLSHAGQEWALNRAKSSISSLAKLRPDRVDRKTIMGDWESVEPNELVPGDIMRVKPFEFIAADATVVTGESWANESTLTGESAPVAKRPGSAILAGTMLGEAPLEARVAKPAGASLLARIEDLLIQARADKSPIELLTARVERWYVPSVMVMMLLVMAVPPLLSLGTYEMWFSRAMSFVVLATPCALVIGTPSALLSGLARAARGGVLMKGGAYFEALGRVDTIAMDKTGTLTTGRPRLERIDALDGWTEDKILQVAGSLERMSTHPLALAVVNAVNERGLSMPPAVETHVIPGVGVEGSVDGVPMAVGGLRLWPDAGDDVKERAASIQREGFTVAAIGERSRIHGLLAVSDAPRASAAPALASLQQLGIRKRVLLTGDNAGAAKRLAETLGIDEFHAGLSPGDKVEQVKRLRESSTGGVVMVGDGVNDGPALAAANVGMAMGAAGSDVALEAADIALLADDLSRVPFALDLARQVRAIMRQNMLLALGVIAVMSPLAILGYTTLAWAVVLHEGSTLVVVMNSLRLLRANVADVAIA